MGSGVLRLHAGLASGHSPGVLRLRPTATYCIADELGHPGSVHAHRRAVQQVLQRDLSGELGTPDTSPPPLRLPWVGSALLLAGPGHPGVQPFEMKLWELGGAAGRSALSAGQFPTSGGSLSATRLVSGSLSISRQPAAPDRPRCGQGSGNRALLSPSLAERPLSCPGVTGTAWAEAPPGSYQQPCWPRVFRQRLCAHPSAPRHCPECCMALAQGHGITAADYPCVPPAAMTSRTTMAPPPIASVAAQERAAEGLEE